MHFNPPQPFAPSLLRLGIYAGGTYYGLHLLNSADPLLYWLGFGLASICAIGAIKNIAVLSRSSRHAAHQLDLDTQSRKPSGIFGYARLAGVHDGVLKRLSRRRGFFFGMQDGKPLFYDPFARGESHIVTIGGTRTGKTTGVVQPALLHWFGGSLVTTDTKGENFAVSGKLRRVKGQRVMRWNPFQVLGNDGMSFNPLSILTADVNVNHGKNLHAYALLISQTLIPDVPGEREPFFRSGGRRYLTALILYVAVIGKPLCHLPGLRQLVWSTTEEKQRIADVMMHCDAYGGLLREYGNHMKELLDPAYAKTFGAMRDYAIDATMIYEGHTDFGQSLMGNDFGVDDILDGKTTLFLSIPESKTDTHGKVIGLIIAILFERIANMRGCVNCMVLLEEAGNIGKIPNLNKALSLLPQKGVRVWLILQSFLQLVLLYGKDVAEFILSQCSARQQFGIRDLNEARFWSLRAGKKTVKTYSLHHDPNDPQTQWKPNVGETERPVLSEDEILRLPENKQLIAISGQPVVMADVVPFYQIEPWRSKATINPYHPKGYPKDRPVILDLEKGNDTPH